MPKPTEFTLTKRPDSGIYQVTIAGRRISLGTRNEQEAREALREPEVQRAAAAASAGIKDRIVGALSGSKKTIPEILPEFSEIRLANGVSPWTNTRDTGIIEQFVTLNKLETTPITKIDERHVGRFVNGDGMGKLKNRERCLQALRKFFYFCTNRGYCDANPAANVTVNHRNLTHEEKESKPTPPFTEAEYRKLIASDKLGDFFVHAVPLAYSAGLRIGDVASLEKASVLPDGLVVWTEKGRRRVVLPYDDKLTPNLQEIIAAIPKNSTPYFFPDEREIHRDTKRRSRHSLYFTRILERVGIEDRSFHSLRATASRRWRAAGFSLDQCREYLGHASAKTTAGYTGDKVEPRRRR